VHSPEVQLCDTGVGRSLSDTGGVHRKNGSDRAVRVRLMGEFELRAADGTVLCVDSVRAESLLAYLVPDVPHFSESISPPLSGGIA